VAAAGALALAPACIPDLSAQLAVDSGDDAAPFNGCGNGVTDLATEQCDPGTPLAPDATFAGCTADCKMDCRGGFVWKNNHCYTKGPKKAATELQALHQCARGEHVVTFASEQEFEAVAGSIDAGPFWVGLVANTGVQPNDYTAQQVFEPGWSPTCSGCFAHTYVEAGMPLPGSPQGCVLAFSYLDASWRQYPCNNLDATGLYVICEREPWSSTAHRCEADAAVCFEIPATYGDKRYVYVQSAATADDAASRCAARGGSLAVLQSSEEREQIWYELSRMPNLLDILDEIPMWIGLSLGDAGWVWDDGNGADAYASPWAADQPNTDAGTRAFLVQPPPPNTPIDTTLASNGAPSSTLLPYLCQIPVNPPDAGDAGEAGAVDAADAGVTE
jgi:hypothetical protein